jgi:hypothetical protein
MAIKRLTLPDRDAIYEACDPGDFPFIHRERITTDDVIAMSTDTPIDITDKRLLQYFFRGMPSKSLYDDWWDERPKGGTVYVYKNAIWHLTSNHAHVPEEHQKLLILQASDKERKDFERLKRLYDSEASKEAKHKREPIPEDVRIAAWRRDEGKCVQCDSNERLEYDHIIPVSKGGSNTVRNIQLLCETCNRKKSDSI